MVEQGILLGIAKQEKEKAQTPKPSSNFKKSHMPLLDTAGNIFKDKLLQRMQNIGACNLTFKVATDSKKHNHGWCF